TTLQLLLSCMVSQFLSVSFFFSDQAPTELYTLSLHDALPICASSAPSASGSVRSRAGRGSSRRPGAPRSSSARRSSGSRCPRRRDRKSTRLNSSHDQISYAVFCLKKKNSKRTKKYNSCLPAAI